MSDDDSFASAGPTFLVVEDNDQVRRLIRQALERLTSGAVLEAADGVDAQDILRRTPIDLVVTDVLMPRMDGRQLMRWAQAECPEPVWIVLSGHDTFDTAVEVLQLGAFDFLAKPLRMGRLRVAVRNALEQIELKRDRARLYRELERSNDRLSQQVDQLSALCRILEDQAELIHEDLARAEIIQRALLPQAPPQLDGWCLESLYRPGRSVGGDLYDIIELGDHHLGVIVADAAGHGVAAAMLSVLFKNRLTVWCDEANAPLEPREVLKRANAVLHPDTAHSGSFITAAYLLLDLRSGEATLAAAGHPPALWIHGSDSHLLDRTGPALGLTAEAEYAQDGFTLDQGDRLLLYTDGLLDGGPEAPTHDDLIAALSAPELDSHDTLRRFHEAATRDARQDPDDITIVLLERSAGESRFDDVPADGDNRSLPSPEPSLILQGAAGDRGFISISGTATWTRSQLFYDALSAMTHRHTQATIDLDRCDYLDSTFLGTLHELVTAHRDSVRLQRVPDRVRHLFDELSMNAVIERIDHHDQPLPPDMVPLSGTTEDTHQQAQRLLKAHEVLATLSEENRAQFQDVVRSLRQELHG